MGLVPQRQFGSSHEILAVVRGPEPGLMKIEPTALAAGLVSTSKRE